MNRPLRLVLWLTFLSPAAALAQATIRVDVVSDVTEAGQALARPTPEKPVYYYPKTIGYSNSGAALAGESAPPTSYVQHLLAKALAEQGYRYMGRMQPSIVLVLAWGYMSPIINQDTQQFANEDEMNTLVFGTTPVDDNRFAASVDAIYAAARVSRYYVTVTALDFAAMAQKKIVPLWCTRVSTELDGHHLAEVLPTLVAQAGPLFGTQTKQARLLVVPEIPEPPAAAK